MNEVVEYFRTLELSETLEPIVIERIHEEIAGNYIDLFFLCGEKLERLISMSEYPQLKRMMKDVRLDTIKTKHGSRIWESIFRRLHVLGKRVKFNWWDYFFDRNATFAVREYLKLGIDLNAKKEIIYQRALKNRSVKEIMGTFGIYLKMINDQDLVFRVIESFLPLQDVVEILSDPHQSFFFESVLEVCDKKNLYHFFSRIESNIENLSQDKCGNYVVQKLLARLPTVIDNLKLNKIDGNILYQVILGTNDHEKMKKLIEKHYGDVFKMIIRDNSIDSKYYRLAIKLFTMPKEHSMGINELFLSKFENKWLYCRYGAEIVLGYLKGHETLDNKNKFISQCRTEFKKMPLKKCSLKILIKMSRICDLETRDRILRILKVHKKQDSYK